MTQIHSHALDRVLAGNDAAIAEFVSTMTPVIQARVARCLMKGTPRDIRRDVEDHSQDVYAHLFSDGAKILRRYDDSHGLSLRNYVGLVAERRVISQLRSSKNNPWRENVSLENEPMPLCGRGSPEREASGQSSLDALLNYLRTTLSPLAWRLFQLLYVHELSVTEVCAETGLSNDAVYAWRSRLRKSARQAQTQLNPGADPP
ncbi:MAG: RNA polymerase sigma factor [Gammaproteobacteria bacterium]